MPEIIDLSQELYSGMPVFPGMPEVRISAHAFREQQEADGQRPAASVNRLELAEHTGTHVDALSHMSARYRERSIERMPLSMFYTRGLCLDLSLKGPAQLIQPDDLQDALARAGLEIASGDTVLLYTDHFRRAFGRSDWENGPGLSEQAARWLGSRRIAAFGVETQAPGVRHVSNRQVHHICGELGFTHYENLINLQQLVGRGYFRFIGLPLRIRGGTGSPVRAVAVFDV